MITICNSIEEISSYLVNLKCENIYISVGSKYNEDFIYMTDKNGKKQAKWTNAMEQIIPNFYREKENSLIICVDCFSPLELEKNKIKIEELLLLPNNNIVLYNSNATIQSVEEFMSYMTRYLITHNIPAEKVLVTNFVRFISPNHTENYFEENIPKVIYKCLSERSNDNTRISERENMSYNTRFYQWFGYQKHTYHLLYNYANYKFMIGYTNILFLLNTIYDEDSLSYNNLYMLQESSHKTSPMYLEIFLKNVMDITGLSEISLYDYFTS